MQALLQVDPSMKSSISSFLRDKKVVFNNSRKFPRKFRVKYQLDVFVGSFCPLASCFGSEYTLPGTFTSSSSSSGVSSIAGMPLSVFLAGRLLFLLILDMAFLSSFLAKARSVVCAAVTSA
uniref:Uncharacterized protein n=1 Tax=Opuntia streptacantha TaxID=393608 RepID=A0A7C9FBE2_OPUST